MTFIWVTHFAWYIGCELFAYAHTATHVTFMQFLIKTGGIVSC